MGTGDQGFRDQAARLKSHRHPLILIMAGSKTML
jgi:hypothetical protein